MIDDDDPPEVPPDTPVVNDPRTYHVDAVLLRYGSAGDAIQTLTVTVPRGGLVPIKSEAGDLIGFATIKKDDVMHRRCFMEMTGSISYHTEERLDLENGVKLWAHPIGEVELYEPWKLAELVANPHFVLALKEIILKNVAFDARFGLVKGRAA